MALQKNETKTWSQIVEEDLYAEDTERFLQWLAEHPDPIKSLKTAVEVTNESLAQARAEIEHLHAFIESKGWCLPAGMPIAECKSVDICDCFLPEVQKDSLRGLTE